MAKYKLQELNDLRDEGKRRVYPKMVTNRTLSRKEFVKMMQNYHRGISESTTEAVLTDVVDMLTDMLSMGYNVNLEVSAPSPSPSLSRMRSLGKF